MNKRFVLLFFFVLFFTGFSFAQKSIVNVNTLTGGASVTIPISVVKRGSVSVPVSLAYYASGIKPKDVESSAGMGWTLQAGGQISRQVRGLPDDCTVANDGTTQLLGWLNTPHTNISGFTIANTGTPNCTSESSDITYINSNFSYNKDSEPDVFNLSAPGISGRFMFDLAGNIKFLTYQDLKISYTKSTATGVLGGAITSFTVTNNQGVKYVFSAVDVVSQTAVQKSGVSVTYFTNTFNQYKLGVKYYSAWHLASITDANKNAISLSYTTAPQRAGKDSTDLFISGSTTKTCQYTLNQVVNAKVISAINGTNQLNFTWAGNPVQIVMPDQNIKNGTDMSYIATITGMGRTFTFSYRPDAYVRAGKPDYIRNFLDVFSETGCSSPVYYKFSYYGQSTTGYTTTTLPDSSSVNVDYWGYSKASTTGTLIPSVYVNPSNSAYPRYSNYTYPNPLSSDYTYSLGTTGRQADTSRVYVGSLATITTVNGGTTRIVYESNDYLDVPSGNTMYGNGIRVKSIVDNDGVSTSHNITRNYTYLNPATGKTSGKPISLPVYAFTIPYTGSATGSAYWNNSTVLSAVDLSDEDHTIMYGYVKESSTGAGATLYQYYVPATEWDNGATPGCDLCTTTEWLPTKTFMARPTCVSYGSVKTDIRTYPFIPAPNYDFERGLVQKISNYNDAGTLVAESNYTYLRTGAPEVITGFRSEDYNGVKGYARYITYASAAELTKTQLSKIYDSPTLATSRQSTVTYTYGSANHELPTQVQTTNSDNSVLLTNNIYVKDYASTVNGDSTTQALYKMKQRNMNALVESYSQVTKGGVTKVTSAGLTKFKLFITDADTLCLPSQSLSYIAPDGIASASFVPSAITANVFAYENTKYINQANYAAYDSYGFVQSVDDNNRNVSGVITDWSSGKPVAAFKGAAVKQVAFNDFDSNANGNTFTFTGNIDGDFPSIGSHSGKAIGFGTSQGLTAGITKKGGVSNYIFSVWLNTATAGTFNIVLTTSASQTYTYPKTVAGNSTWTYYEWLIPVGNMTATFTASLNCTVNISVDDIIFYPENAEVNTINYDHVQYQKIAQTNTNGISTYFGNDQWGRNLYVWDQDRNIVQRNSYITNKNFVDFVQPSIYPPSPGINTQQNITFSATTYDACIAGGITYTWNFGDGSAPIVTTGAISPAHSYATAGTYTVQVTVSSPVYGQKSNTTSVIIGNGPVTLSYNSYTSGGGDISSVEIYNTSGTRLYLFTAAQLNGATIPKGVYNIKVTVTGSLYNSGTGIGYSCVVLTSNADSYNCLNYNSQGIYNYSASLGTVNTLNFTVSQFNCTQFQSN